MKQLVVDNYRTDVRSMCVTAEGNLLCRGMSGADASNIYLSEDSGVTFTLIATLSGGQFLCEVFSASSGTYLGLIAYWDTELEASQFYVARSTDMITWTNVLTLGYSTFLTHGICEDDDGNIYIGEYNTEDGTTDIRLWKSTDDGANFTAVYTFTESTVRHIHFVQLDPYTNNLWMGCGDSDVQSMIGYSSDAVNWTWIDQGSQRARACGALFTKYHVHWGMDVTSETTYMVRYNRSTGVVEKTTRVRSEVMWHHKWETSGVLMATNGYVLNSVDEMNSYFYLADNDWADWKSTLDTMPDSVLTATNSMWNITKEDKSGYVFITLTSEPRAMIRLSLTDAATEAVGPSKAKCAPRIGATRRSGSRTFRM